MIRERLQAKLQPTDIKIYDDSARHAGHPEARASGGGHFTVHIVADCFIGISLIERHRMVYDALENLMKTEIHAVSIRALTVAENGVSDAS